jgi:hypothetical protein
MWLRRLVQRPRSSDPVALRGFLEARAAFVTQKTVLDYCRVKAGRREQQTFADPDFRAALRHCQWQTFGAAVQDLVAMTEAWLRPLVPGREAQLAAALATLGAAVLDAAEAPPEERDGLEAAKAALPRHLMLLQDAPPQSADRMRLLAEAPLLATLPIHPDQRVGETPSIKGALRFHIVSTQQEMERGFDPAALLQELLAPSLR